MNDKSAAIIKQFTKLEGLTLGATDFTEKGALEVAAGLPGCRIQYGYTIEPATDADCKAAEYAAIKGGRVSVNYEERNIKNSKELPKELFRLTIIDLTGTNVTDADLVNFKDCSNLMGLGLRHTQVTDAGLVNFKDCKKLVAIDLDSTDVTDKGLVNFKDCNNLAVLNLNYTKVTDAGLANFKDCRKLTTLCLFRTQVSDKGLNKSSNARNWRSWNYNRPKSQKRALTTWRRCYWSAKLDGMAAPSNHRRSNLRLTHRQRPRWGESAQPSRRIQRRQSRYAHRKADRDPPTTTLRTQRSSSRHLLAAHLPGDQPAYPVVGPDWPSRERGPIPPPRPTRPIVALRARTAPDLPPRGTHRARCRFPLCVDYARDQRVRNADACHKQCDHREEVQAGRDQRHFAASPPRTTSPRNAVR